MSPQSPPLLAQLAAHDETIKAAKTRARELDLAERRVAARVAELSEEIIEAHARGDAIAASKLAKERSKVELDTTRTAAEMVAGAKRVLTRQETERAVFIQNNFAGLLCEIKPDADAAVEAVQDAIDRIGRARASWLAQEARVLNLLRFAGRPTGSTYRLPGGIEALARDASRVDTSNIPIPFPVEYTAAENTPGQEAPAPRQVARTTAFVTRV